MERERARSSTALIMGLAGLIAGCSVAGASPLAGTAGPASPAARSGAPTATAMASATASANATSSSTPIGPSPAHETGPGAAARRLLELASARFTLVVDRWKPGLPDERQAVGSGITDPSRDSGAMTYEWFPDAPDDDPFRIGAEVVWDAADVWTRPFPMGDEPQWRHVTRERAPEMATVGRINEEPLALVRFAAAATSGAFEPLDPATFDGRPAERWLLEVPVETTRAAYVPPDTYLGFETVFGLDALPLEVWLVDGRIVRVGYVLERDEAPYGGPDRFETWYDWSVGPGPTQLVIPPDGEIVDVPG